MNALPTPLRLAILNDYEVIVAGLAAVLSAHDPQIRVIELGSRLPSISDVDIVLLDTFAFASGGLIQVHEVASHARRIGAKVVVYSWNTESESVRLALADGAAGHLWKGLGADELIRALHAIRSGRVVTLGPAQTLVPGEDPIDPAQSRWPGRDLGLSAREAEVLALIAKGMTNEDIAHEMYLGVNTVKTYIRTAYRKIGVSRRTQAVLWALDNGFGMAGRRTVDLRQDATVHSHLTTLMSKAGTAGLPEHAGDLMTELGRRADLVRTVVPDCVGMTLASRTNGVPFTVVATSEVYAALDAVQYLSSGPCVAAARVGQVLTFRRNELTKEPSWRPFAAATGAAGVSSTLSVPLSRHGRVVGTLNLYGATEDAFETRQGAVAAQLQDWATEVAADARLPERRLAVEDMAQHLDDDVDIRAATSKIADDGHLPAQRARLQLDDAAHRAGVTKADVARTILGRPRQ